MLNKKKYYSIYFIVILIFSIVFGSLDFLNYKMHNELIGGLFGYDNPELSKFMLRTLFINLLFSFFLFLSVWLFKIKKNIYKIFSILITYYTINITLVLMFNGNFLEITKLTMFTFLKIFILHINLILLAFISKFATKIVLIVQNRK